MSLQINKVYNRKYYVNPYILSSNWLGTYTVATITTLTYVTTKTTKTTVATISTNASETTSASDPTNASETTNSSDTTKIRTSISTSYERPLLYRETSGMSGPIT
jgi:hypothetical protein